MPPQDALKTVSKHLVAFVRRWRKRKADPGIEPDRAKDVGADRIRDLLRVLRRHQLRHRIKTAIHAFLTHIRSVQRWLRQLSAIRQYRLHLLHLQWDRVMVPAPPRVPSVLCGGCGGFGGCRAVVPRGRHGDGPPSDPEGCISALEGKGPRRRPQQAVRQAVGGGCRSGRGRLLSVKNAIDTGVCHQGESGWARKACCSADRAAEW